MKPLIGDQCQHQEAGIAATMGEIGARSRPRSNGDTAARMTAVKPADLASMAVMRGLFPASQSDVVAALLLREGREHH